MAWFKELCMWDKGKKFPAALLLVIENDFYLSKCTGVPLF